MTVVAIDGFDVYTGVVTNTGVQAKWPVNGINGTVSGSMVTGRFGGQAVRLQLGTTSTGLAAYARTLPSGYSSLAIGVAYRCNNLTLVTTATNIPIILQFVESTTYHVHLTVSSDGKINAYRASSSIAGTLLGSSSAGVILTNTWHYIEAEVVISDAAGRVTVYVDGVQVINLTSQDTKNGGSGPISVINLCCNAQAVGNAPTHDFDDFYCVDAATKLGERKVETLYPTSDVAQGFSRSTGSTNYTLVDEATVNGDTDYVQASSLNTVDTYGFGDLSNSPTTIDAVQFACFAEKTDATARSIALQAISGATTSDGSNFVLTASYNKFERLMTTDPNTSSAWGASAVNALTGGPKVTV